MFSEKLNAYISRLDCSGKELSDASGISEATISRYRTGGRIPKPDSKEMEGLCRGISLLAEQKGLTDISYAGVSAKLSTLAAESNFNYSSLQTKMNLLFSALSVNTAEISKALRYDSSYVSRIRSGQRRPAKPEEFAEDLAEYIARRYTTESEKKALAALLAVADPQLTSTRDTASRIAQWLLSVEASANPIEHFLEKLSDFDLNEYIRAIHFDDIKVPSLPFQLPTFKTYYGLDKMKNGELDFLKATVLSKSQKDVFMCSDMQMDDMAKDVEFAKKYMFGLAAMLKKGLRLTVIHNINRPFNELMLGLENWIPLYMTGQIAPYYIKGVHNRVFCHFLNVSGAAALSGESVAGHHADGKYYLTKNKTELAYYTARAAHLLQKAQPLMEIYRADAAGGLNAFLLADVQTEGRRKNLLSSLPLYTMPSEFLNDFLKAHHVSADDAEKIKAWAETQKRWILNIVKHSAVTDFIPLLSEEEFQQYPIVLSLSTLFYEKDLVYTYDAYKKHMEYTKQFTEAHPNYTVQTTAKNAFRNMQIVIHEGKWALISKNKSPSVHFVVSHPVMLRAIENLTDEMQDDMIFDEQP